MTQDQEYQCETVDPEDYNELARLIFKTITEHMPAQIIKEDVFKALAAIKAVEQTLIEGLKEMGVDLHLHVYGGSKDDGNRQ